MRMCHVGVHGGAGWLLGAIQRGQGSDIFPSWEVHPVSELMVCGWVMSVCMAVRDSYWGLCTGARGAVSFSARKSTCSEIRGAIFFSAGNLALSAASRSADVSCQRAWRCGIATGGYTAGSGERYLSRLGSSHCQRLHGLRMCHVGMHGGAG
jgi:hypothetical protein